MEKILHYLLLLTTLFVGSRELFINQNALFSESFSGHTQTLLILLVFMLLFITSMIMNITEIGKSINPKLILLAIGFVITVTLIESYPYLKNPEVAKNLSHLGSLSILTLVTFSSFASLLILFDRTENQKDTSQLVY